MGKTVRSVESNESGMCQPTLRGEVTHEDAQREVGYCEEYFRDLTVCVDGSGPRGPNPVTGRSIREIPPPHRNLTYRGQARTHEIVAVP